MPIYEYYCKDCDRKIEKLFGWDYPTEITCFICGSQAKKVLSVPAPAIFSPYLKELREGNLLDY